MPDLNHQMQQSGGLLLAAGWTGPTHLFSPKAKMQTNLASSSFPIFLGLSFHFSYGKHFIWITLSDIITEKY